MDGKQINDLNIVMYLQTNICKKCRMVDTNLCDELGSRELLLSNLRNHLQVESNINLKTFFQCHILWTES